MRDINKYAEICMEMLDELNIPYNRPESFTINTRAARRWGECVCRYGKFYININQTLLDERNSDDGLVNTILHELLHTCKGCNNHGAIWKNYASMVYRAYGYNIKRTSSEEDKGVTTGNLNYKKSDARFLVYCEKCGELVASRKKRCSLVENPSLYKCGICRGNLYVVDLDGAPVMAAADKAW